MSLGIEVQGFGAIVKIDRPPAALVGSNNASPPHVLRTLRIDEISRSNNASPPHVLRTLRIDEIRRRLGTRVLLACGQYLCSQLVI